MPYIQFWMNVFIKLVVKKSYLDYVNELTVGEPKRRQLYMKKNLVI